ncbi:MAG TPA: hypothetical protein VND64_01485 [Pirellulales bacterium]|nr:hypothetical protein [Pirellulales bacterium]
MENPYQSPQDNGSVPFSEGGSGGLGSHIRIVAILMMVQGGLESLIAVLLLIMGGVMPTIFGAMAAGAPAGPGQAPPPPAAVGWIVGGFYFGYGVVVLVVGVLNLVAGWRNFWFRGRAMGLVALSLGLVTLLTCYCFPTAAALFIYGLIVYLNGQSTRWFALGARGATPEAIQTTW